MTTLKADGRIKLAIGEQFVQIQHLQDEIATRDAQLAERDVKIGQLTEQLAERDAKIWRLENPGKIETSPRPKK